MKVFGKRAGRDVDNILFATDFSPAAEKAGLYVKALAQHFASKVQLVHVVNRSAAFQAPDAGICIDCFHKSAEDSMNRAKTQFTSGVREVETILTIGTAPEEEILQIAKENSADLIVTGTRGQEGFARFAFGSMAEQLIHHAECPVLTIGPNARPPESAGVFQRIVYATDFSAEAAKAATYALSFAQERSARIYLCHVLPEPKHLHRADSQELTETYAAALRELIPDIARDWYEPECVLEHGYAADGILLLAHRVNADLIILGTRRVSHWFDLLKPGIAYEVIQAATCPVLTVRG